MADEKKAPAKVGQEKAQAPAKTEPKAEAKPEPKAEQRAESISAPEIARPEPSQEECDRIRDTSAGGSLPYMTRQAKAK